MLRRGIHEGSTALECIARRAIRPAEGTFVTVPSEPRDPGSLVRRASLASVGSGMRLTLRALSACRGPSKYLEPSSICAERVRWPICAYAWIDGPHEPGWPGNSSLVKWSTQAIATPEAGSLL